MWVFYPVKSTEINWNSKSITRYSTIWVVLVLSGLLIQPLPFFSSPLFIKVGVRYRVFIIFFNDKGSRELSSLLLLSLLPPLCFIPTRNIIVSYWSNMKIGGMVSPVNKFQASHTCCWNRKRTASVHGRLSLSHIKKSCNTSTVYLIFMPLEYFTFCGLLALQFVVETPAFLSSMNIQFII